jgi:hypothetical protein
MMKKLTIKSAVMMMLLTGLLAISASSAFAQGRQRCNDNRSTRGGYVNSTYNDRYNSRVYNDRYNDRYYDNYQSTYYQGRNNDRYDDRRDRWEREDTTGKTIKRVGIGSAIGAVGGAVIGGKKGALIGAGVGAAGGYIYHRNKVNDRNDRRFRWPL